ncbi:4'-phosphopantetheinyl transferase superfamily protein [Algoriphagus sp.]|uniref:4'-phosphopantetheinyl transferase family protein n=1 Tax=Algoriphagus sp. TaxID=1872435 RepID=UPI00261DBB92|nr:4'-phosphopantetheinyl transferase superfamily protein [Algoriphagus sp.]
MQDKASQFRNWKDRTNSILGKVMLKHCASRYYNIPNILNQVSYNPFQRPEVDGPFSFSISHSGNMVVCALSETHQLGIDIESLAAIDFDPYQEYLSDKEWMQIKLAMDPNREFLKIWTQKEAVIKADGRGLTLPLKELNPSDSHLKIDKQSWYLHQINLQSNYICHLATDKVLKSQDIKTVDCMDLIINAFIKRPLEAI